MLKEGTLLLSSFPPDQGMEDYPSDMEKAMVLYFKVARLYPDEPESYLRLGRLSELRALWAQDPADRQTLLDEAQVFSARAARAAFDRSFDMEALRRYEESLGQGPLGDPWLSSLTWAGRLRRGEVDLVELRERHGDQRIAAENNPMFWEDRLFLLSGLPKEDKARAIEQAIADFETHVKVMPSEVLVSPANRKFAGLRLTKAAVINAWAHTLTQLSAAEADPELREALFLSALEVFGQGLALPLGHNELAMLQTALEKADYAAPPGKGLDALFDLKDKLFAKWAKQSPKDPTVPLHRGSDLMRRAMAQPDPAEWSKLLKEAAAEYGRHADMSEDKALALHEAGVSLERHANSLAGFLALPRQTITSRRQDALLMAADFHRASLKERPGRPSTLRSLAGALLSAALLAEDDKGFARHFDEAVAYARDAAMGGLDPGYSFFAWGERILSSQPPANVPEASDRMLAEGLTAFRQYLRAGGSDPETLSAMANLCYQAAERSPSQRAQALNLLIDVSQTLVRERPEEASYRFAHGLAVASRISAEEDFPLDPALFNTQAFRLAYMGALSSFSEGLELLSFGSPPSFSRKALEDVDRFSRGAAFRRPPGSGEDNGDAPIPIFLQNDDFIRVPMPGTSHQDRLTGTLNQYVNRLFSMMPPEGLPPWYKLRLASFLRLSAASGYLPLEEECAYFRLSYRLLGQALLETRQNQGEQTLASWILAEQGLVLAESTLSSRDDPGSLALRERALASATALWAVAEEGLPGSSSWARARWAAWGGDKESLTRLLAHGAAEGDGSLWPSFQEAALEPAFREYRDLPWFKKAWFGYGR